MADAEIKFDTSIDQRGFEKGVKGMEDRSGGLKQALIGVGEAIDSAFTSGEVEDTTAAIMKQQAVVDELRAKLTAIADIEATAPIIEQLRQDIDAAIVEASRFDDEIESLNNRLSDPWYAEASEAQMEAWKADLDAAIQKSTTAGDKVDALKGQLAEIKMPEQPKESAEVLSQKLGIATKRLDEMKSKFNESAASGKNMTRETTAGMDQLAASVQKTGNRIKNLVVGAFVFNVLRQGIKEFRDYVFLAAKENEQFSASFNQFKANISAIIQPLLSMLIPGLTSVAQVFSTISGYLLQIVALITNQNVQQLYAQARSRDKATRAAESSHAKELEAYTKRQAKAAEQRRSEEEKEAERIAKELKKQEDARRKNQEKYQKAVDKQAKSQEKLTAKLKKQNEEMSRSTASFDDLITLSADATEELDSMTFDDIQFEELEFDGITSNLKDAIIEGFEGGFSEGFGIYDNLSEPKELTQKITDLINSILVLTGLALMVIGVILLFTGAGIPTGLAMIALGAGIMYAAAKMAWGSMSSEVKTAIENTLLVVGLVAVILGCILFFTGIGTTVGLALIAMGIPAIVTGVALKWDSMSGEAKDAIEAVLEIVGLVAVVLGCFLLFTGAGTGAGIALIAAGAVALVTPIVLNWNSMSLQEKIGAILEVVGYVAIAIGCLLLFTGMLTPLGIGLIALGAAAVVTSIALKWNSMDSLGEKFGAILKVIGVIAIIIGIIMLFTGAGIPLGIGLIALGAVSIVSAIAMNSDAIKDKIENVMATLAAIAAASMIVLGLILICVGLLPLGIGLLIAGIKLAELAQEHAADDNKIVAWVTGVVDKIKDAWENFKTWFFNLWHSLPDGIKGAVNIIIAIVNAMISAVAGGMNSVIDALNKLQIDMPDWLGGGSFGFNISHVIPPQIPMLAQGAVIPGGAPFLAVLGDQSRGQTNIEAPLSTIEAALENVFMRHADSFGGQDRIAEVSFKDGGMAAFMRFFNIELEKERARATAF